jgi:hypothetical protein
MAMTKKKMMMKRTTAQSPRPMPVRCSGPDVLDCG